MASKSKWKKRLKKIGKVAAIAGAAALAGKLASKRRSASIAGMDDAGIGVTHPALTGGEAVTNVVNPNLNKVAADTGTTGGSYLSRMGGAGNRATQIANQKKRANLAQRGRIINPHEATAAAGAAYRPGIVRPGGRLNIKHGGKVTGIATRGFGRALMKGKK